MKRLALFSCFIQPSEKIIPRYIFIYLAQMRTKVTTLVFIYNNDFSISDEDRTLLSKFVDDIMPVKNEGFDFGMWQKGLEKHNVTDYDELCLFNDSCICIGSFEHYFAWHDSIPATITSLTQSQELAAHLQSYFLCIKKPAIETVVDYILKMHFSNLDYLKLIIAGEIGLSLYCIFRGLYLTSYYPPAENNLNITLDLPQRLVIDNSPLIKKKVLLSAYKAAKEQLAHSSFISNELFLSDLIKQHRHLDERICHQLFGWMPAYVLDKQVYHTTAP